MSAGQPALPQFEDCLLPKPTFAALRAEGPLPVGVEEDVERHLATRRDALAAAMESVAVLAKAGRLFENHAGKDFA